MLDAVLHPRIEPFLANPAARIAAYGIRADALTVAAFLVGIAGLPDITHRAYLTGLGLITFSRLFDVADGAVARHAGPTRFGAYLAQVLDLVWTASIPFAFALAQPERALAAMFFLIGLVARAAALTAEVRHAMGAALSTAELGANLVGKSEIFVAFALACIFPDWFSVIAYVLGISCFVMVGFRVAAAAQHS